MAVDNHIFTIIEISTVSAVKFYFRYMFIHRILSIYIIFIAKPSKTWIFSGFRAFCYLFTGNNNLFSYTTN